MSVSCLDLMDRFLKCCLSWFDTKGTFHDRRASLLNTKDFVFFTMSISPNNLKKMFYFHYAVFMRKTKLFSPECACLLKCWQRMFMCVCLFLVVLVDQRLDLNKLGPNDNDTVRGQIVGKKHTCLHNECPK